MLVAAPVGELLVLLVLVCSSPGRASRAVWGLEPLVRPRVHRNGRQVCAVCCQTQRTGWRADRVTSLSQQQHPSCPRHAACRAKGRTRTARKSGRTTVGSTNRSNRSTLCCPNAHAPPLFCPYWRILVPATKAHRPSAEPAWGARLVPLRAPPRRAHSQCAGTRQST